MMLKTHLFLSYAHADLERIYSFHARMQAATGHHIWIDKVGLRQGIEWENALHRAVTTSYGVIFAVTKAFCESTYIREKEIPWAVVRFRDKQGPLLFPILFDDALLPDALNLPFVTHTIDARDGDYQRVFDELKAVLPQPHDGDHRFIVSWPRLLTFQGREDMLIQLHDSLMQHNGRVGVHAATHGMGGVGKTQLAVEYAHRYRFHYPVGVYWVNAAQSWTHELAEIAKNVGLSLPDAGVPDYERQMVAVFNNYLREQDGDALIILDNVENPADVLHREAGPMLKMVDFPVRLLITTRRGDLPQGFAGLSVTALPLEDARRVLLAARPDAAGDSTIDDICKALGCLPLALGLVAAALKKRRYLTPAKFLEYYKEQGLDEIIRRIKLTHADLNVAEYYDFVISTLLEWHWKQLKTDHARSLITLTAAYGEAAQIPLARLHIMSDIHDDPDGLEQPFADAVAELHVASLVEDVGENTIRLHPLVRDYLRKKTPSLAQQIAEGAAQLVIAYRTPQTLHDEAAVRDFGAVIADLRETRLALLPEFNRDLNMLERYFDWEGHHLRDSKQHEQPAYLIQHIRERAHHQSDDALCDACDQWLAPYPHLRTEDPWRFPNDPALIRVFEGHTDWINAVAILPNGQGALSASGSRHGRNDDHTIHLWDTETGTEVRRFVGHDGPVASVEVSPNGHLALSGSYDRTLRLWDIKTGEEIRRFEGHTADINSVTFLPDGRRALSASGSWDNTLRLWDVETGREIRRFEGHIGPVTSVAILPGGRRVLSASYDRTLRLWDIETGIELRKFREWADYIKAVVLLPDGRRALSISGHNSLEVWDIESGDILAVYRAKNVNAVAVLPDRQVLLACGEYGSTGSVLRLWDIDSGTEIRRFEGHRSAVTAVAVSRDGGRALSGSQDLTLRLWDIKARNESQDVEGHTEPVWAIGVLPDGRHVLSARHSRSIALWDTETGVEVWGMERYTVDSIWALAIMPSGRMALVASKGSRRLSLWDIEAGAEVREFELTFPPSTMPSQVNAIAPMNDGRRVMLAFDDYVLRLCDVMTDKVLQVFKGHKSDVRAVAVVDEHCALSASNDHTLRLWDIATGEGIRRFEGHTGTVWTVEILPRKRALSASSDSTLRLWDVETGAELQRFEGHSSIVTKIVVLNEEIVISASGVDATLRLWNINTGNTLATLQLEEGPTALAALGGSRIVVGSQSGKVRVIRVVLPGGA